VTTRRDFVQEILADPTNDLLRLVFADFLEENGDQDRAEFIRLQIELSHWHYRFDMEWKEHSERNDLIDRVSELFEANHTQWIYRVPSSCKANDHLTYWERGCLKRIATSGEFYLEDINKVLDREPADCIRLFLHSRQRNEPAAPAWAVVLATSPLLRWVTRIDIEESGLPLALFYTVIASPHLTGLRDIWCQAAVGPAGVAALGLNSSLVSLQAVSLVNLLTDPPEAAELPELVEAFRTLAAAPHLGGLRYLDLRHCGVREGSLVALAGSAHLPREMKLSLEQNWQPSAELAALLAGRFVFYQS